MARKRADGEGTIYEQKQRNRWAGEFPYKDQNGKTHKKTFIGKTQKEVARKGKEFLKNIEAGLLPEADKITVGEWLERWLMDYVKPNVSINSYEKYSTDLKNYVIPKLGGEKLIKLQSPTVQRLFNDMLDHGRTKPRQSVAGKGLSSSIVRTTRRYFTMAIDKAVELGMVSKNVVKQTKPPKLIKREISPLSEEQASILLETAKKGGYMPKEYYTYHQTYEREYTNSLAYAVLLIALNTGMRRGEVLGLRWEDIDFKANKVNVKRSLVVSKVQGTIFQETKTKGSVRNILVTADVMKELRHYKKVQEWFKNLMGDKYEDSTGIVFTTTFGKPVNGCSFVSRTYKRILAAAGISDQFTFHDLRHTHATMLLRRGVNIKVIAERLGHSNISMTLDTYSHLMPDMQHVAVDTLDKIFKKA